MKYELLKKTGGAVDAEMRLLEVVAAEMDDLEARTSAVRAREEDVAKWTGGAGIIEEEVKGEPA
jgi:hypothetical protein